MEAAIFCISLWQSTLGSAGNDHNNNNNDNNENNGIDDSNNINNEANNGDDSNNISSINVNNNSNDNDVDDNDDDNNDSRDDSNNNTNTDDVTTVLKFLLLQGYMMVKSPLHPISTYVEHGSGAGDIKVPKIPVKEQSQPQLVCLNLMESSYF